MRYLKLFSGFILMMLLMLYFLFAMSSLANDKSLFNLMLLVLWFVAAIIIAKTFNYFDYIKCPKCKEKSRSTDVVGTVFSQYKCTKCSEIFFIYKFSGKYEHDTY